MSDMKSILICGAGEYGRLVKEIAELNGYSFVDFLDDNSNIAIGKLKEITKYEKNYDDSIVAIGNPIIREEIVSMAKKLTTLYHPSASISKSAIIEKGCIVEANCVINSEAIVKMACLICAGAVVNHNSIIEDYCQIDCNAVVLSGSHIPKGTKIECGCVR